MQIHDGFPTDRVLGTDSKTKGFLMRFDPKSLLMPDDYFDATFLGHTKLASSPPTYRFTFDVAQPGGKVGDYVAVSHLTGVISVCEILKCHGLRNASKGEHRQRGRDRARIQQTGRLAQVFC